MKKLGSYVLSTPYQKRVNDNRYDAAQRAADPRQRAGCVIDPAERAMAVFAMVLKDGRQAVLRPATDDDWQPLVRMYESFEPKRAALGLPPLDNQGEWLTEIKAACGVHWIERLVSMSPQDGGRVSARRMSRQRRPFFAGNGPLVLLATIRAADPNRISEVECRDLRRLLWISSIAVAAFCKLQALQV